MEAKKVIYSVLCLLLLSGCANDPFNSLFPQSTNSVPQDPQCPTSSFLANRFIVQWQDGHMSVESQPNVSAFKATFRNRVQQIRHVEYDQVVHLRDSVVSVSRSSDPQWGQKAVHAASAWNAGIYGQGVLVGVVDAAIDYSHPQLKNRLAANPAEIHGRTGIDDDGNGFIDDYYGWDFYQNQNNPANIISSNNEHGTHVSGIIAAEPSSNMQGLAPQAQIIAANFMDTTESGSLGDGIQAIQYAVSRGARVINASWGGPACSQNLKAMINSLAAKNVLFVAASGNDGVDLDSTPDYPASFNFPNQLNVAASNSNDFLTNWSNTSFSSVHLGAPGDFIYSTVPGGFAYMSGTSMASPFVTGAAALLISLRPQATYAQIRQALLAGVDSKGFRVQSQGRLNIANSMEALKKILPK